MVNMPELKKIIEDLKNPRSFVRTRATDSLMAIKDESIIPEFFKMVHRETDFVKVQFTRFLGKIKGYNAVPPLVILLLDKSDMVAREAANALDMIDNDRKNDAMMLFLRRKAPHFVRMFSIRSLGAAKVQKAVPYLVALLSSREEEIKEASIEALRQIGDPMAIRPLVRMLKDKNDRIIYYSITALAEIGDAKNAASIFPFLRYRSENVRRAAVWALSKLNYENAIPLFIKMLKDDPSESVREEVVKRLGKMGGAGAVSPLIHAKAFDKSHNVRIYSEWAMRDIPIKEKEDILLRLSRDKDGIIRGEALLELGRIGEYKFFKTLSESAKKDKSEYARACAIEGLSFIQKPGVKEILKAALQDKESVRIRACDALLRWIEEEDAGFAIDMAAGVLGSDIYLRDTGLKMLERIYFQRQSPETTLESLYRILEKADENTQKLVVRTLGKIGDPATYYFLKDLEARKGAGAIKSEIEEALDNIKRKNL